MAAATTTTRAEIRQEPVTVVIASPLEEEHAAGIAAAYPGRVEVIHRPDLLPPPR